VFARLANGNPEPVRAIEGQGTKIARTMHSIAYDAVHDEIVVTQPFAEGVLFFKGSANGEEPPLRVIQGPKTYINRPDALAIDPINNEVYVPLKNQGAILVFSREANGDVAPKRILRGPKTRLTPNRLVVDPVNNLLIVGNIDPPAILTFNRTDEGDVAPRRIVSGSKADIGAIQAIELYPEKRKIVAAVTDSRVFNTGAGGRVPYIGVWNYDDEGDVAAHLVIKGPASQLGRPRGVALNPKHKEIHVVDMAKNSLFTYSFPGLF
jgi:hypothetical protein